MRNEFNKDCLVIVYTFKEAKSQIIKRYGYLNRLSNGRHCFKMIDKDGQKHFFSSTLSANEFEVSSRSFWTKTEDDVKAYSIFKEYLDNEISMLTKKANKLKLLKCKIDDWEIVGE